MTDMIIVGTVALDSVETPFGKADDALGGSASYAATAASFFAKPGIISIIGEDFPQEHLDFLQSKGIDLEGIKKEGKSFRWEGYYEYDMNEAKTRKTELNSLATFKPSVPESYKKAKAVFLANIDPEVQLEVVNSLDNPEIIVLDTMNFWIESKKDKLLEIISKASIFVLNEGEARQLFETTNLVQAANKALELGPKAVIIKKGEHGALLFTDDKHFSAPGYPLENVMDPTGCGDCFGGGMLGYLVSEGKADEPAMRKAIIYGSVIASHNAEDFSLNRLKTLTQEEIETRYRYMKDIREF